MKVSRYVGAVAAGLMFAATFSGCSATPKNESKAAELSASSKTAMDNFTTKDPTIQQLLDKSVGYAIFPSVGKGAWIIGGSYGKGEVFDKGGSRIGYADVSQVSIGLQGGASNISELLIFPKQADLDQFKTGDFSVAGNVSVVALKSGSAASADTTKGVIVFVETNGGLMAEAAVGGQRMRFRAE